MLTLFKKNKYPEESDCPTVELAENSEEMNAAAKRFIEQVADEATMKKNIAEKLRKYRPVEREADFSNNKLYR
ncbi:MAG: hypothetical protein K6L76_02090 [Agarilytica sp.]